MLFDTSLEEANATDDELAAIATELATEHGVSIDIAGKELRDFHEERAQRARQRGTEIPGLASSLVQVVSKTAAGAWHVRKRDLVERLASKLADEIHTLPPEDWRRPISSFLSCALERMTCRPSTGRFPVGASD